jgi:Tfp pilus assembly protein PilV
MKHAKVQLQPREGGFTLLETAAATMIMSVGLMAIMQLFVLSMVYNKSSTQTTIAATLAKRQMERLLALPLPPSTEPAPLGFSATGAQLGKANKVTGYFENYYVDFDRNGQKGTMRLSTTPFFTGQEISYVVTWIVERDSVTVLDPVTNTQVPALPGLRRITIRAEATQAGMQGNMMSSANGAAVTQTPESAQLSTIRTPFN